MTSASERSYRQPFTVENANRRARKQATESGVNADVLGIMLSDVYEVGQKATVVPVRDITFDPRIKARCTYDGDVVPREDPDNILGTTYADMLPVVTDTQHFASFLAAVNKRSNHMQDRGMGKEQFDAAMAIINEIPDGLFPAWDENDADRQAWLSGFSPSKVADMEQGLEELQDATYEYLGTKDLSVKKEKLWDKRNDASWAPRVIYAGNRAFNAVTGPACKVIMQRMVELVSNDDHARRIGPIHAKFAYKTDDVSIGRFLMRDEECVFTREGDFSSNDKFQVQEVALLYDAWIAKLGMPQWFRTLLLKLEEYKVRSRHFEFQALLKYQLPTGTTSTTPRNSFYNLIMFAVTCRKHGVRKGYACILGDDILARLSDPLCCSKWADEVTAFCMKLKGSAPELHLHATLLSRRFIVRDTLAFAMPDFRKFVAGFNIRATLNEQLSDDVYMAGKALSFAYEFRHIPIIRDMLMEFFRSKSVDVGCIALEDLSWFTRSSGISTPQDILERIKREPVTCTEDEFIEAFITLYDLDEYDLIDGLNHMFYAKEINTSNGFSARLFD